MVVDRRVSRISSSVVTSGWGGLGIRPTGWVGADSS